MLSSNNCNQGFIITESDVDVEQLWPVLLCRIDLNQLHWRALSLICPFKVSSSVGLKSPNLHFVFLSQLEVHLLVGFELCLWAWGQKLMVRLSPMFFFINRINGSIKEGRGSTGHPLGLRWMLSSTFLSLKRLPSIAHAENHTGRAS